MKVKMWSTEIGWFDQMKTHNLSPICIPFTWLASERWITSNHTVRATTKICISRGKFFFFHVPVIDGCQKVKMSIDDKKVGHFEGNASMDKQINRLSLVSSTSVEGSCQKISKNFSKKFPQNNSFKVYSIKKIVSVGGRCESGVLRWKWPITIRRCCLVASILE